jgi:hypothetical protein
MRKLLLALGLVIVALPAGMAWAQTGACCGYIDGLCTDGVTESECVNAIFGQYMGDGTTCAEVTCPPIGACCDPDTGNCVMTTTEMLCVFYWNRTWLGEGTNCEGENPCPQPPRGACCMPNGTCQPEMSEYDCTNQTIPGTWLGEGTTCDPNPCPQPVVGACCFSTGGCLVLEDWLCLDNEGVFQGEGTVCWPSPCGTPSLGWSDNFDSYENGTYLYHVGGWYGWDDNAAACGSVSDVQSHSAPHAIMVNDTADAIHPFVPTFKGDQWVITAWQYLPSDLSGMTYFIVNSYYEDGGTKYWAVELHFDPATGQVTDGLRDPTGASPLPLVYDQWVEIRCEIDFETSLGTVSEYYNNQLLYTGDWVISIGTMAIANIDLYAPQATPVYYDDFSVYPAAGPQPPPAVRPLFVGTADLAIPTRTTDLSGFPDVTWLSGYDDMLVDGAAGRPDGAIYLSQTQTGGQGRGIFIAPLEGPPIKLCSSTSSDSLSGLAYARGKLYGYRNSSPLGIYEVNTETCALTLVLATGSYRFFALDYNAADGLLYGYTEYGSPTGLYSIDIDTGTMTWVAGNIPAGNSAARGMACGNNKVYLVSVYGDSGYPMYVYDLAQGPGGTYQPMTHPYPTSHATTGAAWTLGPVTGDTNCDGVVDFGDINPFVAAIVSVAGYEAQYPDCTVYNADINLDGQVDFGDINPFVGLLSK